MDELHNAIEMTDGGGDMLGIVEGGNGDDWFGHLK